MNVLQTLQGGSGWLDRLLLPWWPTTWLSDMILPADGLTTSIVWWYPDIAETSD